MGAEVTQIKAGAPSIFGYHDYRAYIRDLLAHAKKKDSEYSLRHLGKQAGVSAAYLSVVLSGHKNLSEKISDKLIKVLGLTEDEASYFRLLRTIADSDEAEERHQALEQIQKFRRYRRMNPRETEIYRYLTKWYYVAIRELATLPDFKMDPHWIQERLCYPLSQQEIQKALRFLLKYKFIEERPDGSIHVPDKRMECWAGVFRVALGQFYRQIYGLASQSIEVTPRDERHIIGDTLAIPAESFEEFKAVLDESLRRISQLGNSKSNPDSIYHFGFLGFPIAKGRKVEP
ncbi:MAG TPA: TIGR02147 family protein [Bdellovibrionales bacterium]|nr:TIGR02147 family protein [Bdellovibrionales bacterium]